MGRNDGPDEEKPEHQVTVNAFMMDRTEVTNEEYHAFVSETGYKPFPSDWENGRPLSGQEKWPVRFVNIDDVNAFIAWRSKRDGVTYRLPSEEEWEYAARNGSKSNLYPWGDKFDPNCAVLNDQSNKPQDVGTKTCKGDFGVQDLIGNVYEWTSSPPALYPGSTGSVKQLNEPFLMIRGGSFYPRKDGKQSVTSTFRYQVPAKTRDRELGFRLVRSS
jgi:formylglycine-generating enzyme required for sulfatase activity